MYEGNLGRDPSDMIHLVLGLSEPFDLLTRLTAVNESRKRNEIYTNALHGVNPLISNIIGCFIYTGSMARS